MGVGGGAEGETKIEGVENEEGGGSGCCREPRCTCLLLTSGEHPVAVSRKLCCADNVVVLELVELVATEGIPDLQGDSSGQKGAQICLPFIYSPIFLRSVVPVNNLWRKGGEGGGVLTLIEKSAEAVAAISAWAFKEADHTAPCTGVKDIGTCCLMRL